ncbi:very short patch repair endonuclease [Cryobacterium sp. ZS14-85]|uniref:Very short patch repair endonuclease n=1 Tax=Cryobacterium zhongshanensis TaxID=2928153 RepID=A0AA41QSX0_9MICO|nr:very short patch repair endonuclease [Cryobacterium zhongshanensis]
MFLDGCFWHGCPEHGTHPRANADRWAVKLR